MRSVDADARLAVDRLRSATRVLATCHRRPDGDALGSELALAELADRLDVPIVVWNRDPAPASLSELPGADRIVVSDVLPDDFPSGFDLVATLECPDLDRAGYEGLDAVAILNIDHHPANPLFGEVNFIDEEAPAVGELVWRMYRTAGITPSVDAATNAFVALSTDTGDFRYSNATARAFRAAAEMVDAGASPERVANWVHGRRNEASIRLLGEALRTLRLERGGQIAVIEVDRDAFSRSGAQPSDSEDIISHPRSIAGVEAVVFLKQWEPGTVHVSLRSKGAVDVRRVAASFGGGGHANASGCTIESDLSTARRLVTAELIRLVEGGA